MASAPSAKWEHWSRFPAEENVVASSTYRDQYIGHAGAPPPTKAGDVRRAHLFKETQLTHVSPEHYLTTAKDTFLPNLVPTPAVSFAVKPHRVVTSPFAFTTTALSHFDTTLKAPEPYCRRNPERKPSPLLPTDNKGNVVAVRYLQSTNAAFAAATRDALRGSTPESSDYRVQPFRPKSELELPQGVLTNETTYRAQFPSRGVEGSPLRHRPPRPPRRIADSRDFVTTGMANYRDHSAAVAEARHEQQQKQQKSS